MLATARHMLDGSGMLEAMTAAALKTFEDLALLGDDTRAELIEGEILQKALPMGEHSGAEGYLQILLGRRFDRPAGGRWPGGWWIRPEIHVGYDKRNVFCHDLAGWRRTTSPEKPLGWPVRVRPDWVCEILSPSHEKRDRRDKMRVLQRLQVPYYWLISHEEKLLEIYRHTADGYVLVRTAGSDETIRAEPFDAVELRAAVIFGDVPDEE